MKIFTSKTQKIGEKGEDAAVKYLIEKQYSIIDRNNSNRFGEIDVIAQREGNLYFFEVKAGRRGSWVNPAENLTKTKLKKFYKAIDYYCVTHGVREYCVQGIVVVLDIKGKSDIEIIELS